VMPDTKARRKTFRVIHPSVLLTPPYLE
jgi:hypothetical protein